MKAWLALVLLLAAQAREAETVLNRGNGAEPDSLDPAFAGTTMETNILGQPDGRPDHFGRAAARARPRHGGALGDFARRPDLDLSPAQERAGQTVTTVTAGDFVFGLAAAAGPEKPRRAKRRLLWVVEKRPRHHRRSAPAPPAHWASPPADPLTLESHTGASPHLTCPRTA